MAVFRKSDPANILILGLESEPKSKPAQFKLILVKLYRNSIEKKCQAQHIFNNI